MLQRLDQSIVERYVRARRSFGIAWAEYETGIGDELLSAMLWESDRQQYEEQKTMMGGGGILRSAELNKVRKAYLEVYQDIAGKARQRQGETCPSGSS